MRAFLSRLAILFAMLGLIAAPALLSAQADIRRAESDISAGRPLDASASFERASLFLFWRADLKERAGRAAFAGGDAATAARLLSQPASLSVDGWRELGAAYYELRRFADSARALQRGLERYGANAALYRQLALAFNAQEEFQSETGALQNYIALEDGEAAAHHRLGLLLSIFNPNSAYAELAASVKLDADYASAAQTMRDALDLASIQSNEADRFVVIGRGLGLVGEWRLARESFQRAANADGKNAQALAWLGEAKQHLGQDGGADLARAVALDPFSASVRALYGLYWKRQDEPQKALAQFQWAAAIEPNDPAYQAALAEAFVFSGDLPPALAAYQRAAQLAPKEKTYWRLLALFSAQYFYQVNEVGIPAARQVAALAPQEAASFDLLGWTYFAADLPSTAELNFLKALRLDKNYASAHLHLGMLYFEIGRAASAREHLLKAQSLDPNGADGQAAAKLLASYFP